MIINNAVIELTRRCNMSCAHCLRGDAENLDMKRYYLESFFSKVRYISHLTLTGGEPSLVPEIIHMVIDVAEKHGVEIGSFYVATNAKALTPTFTEAVMRFYAFCTDNEMSGVEWSNDIYHDDPEPTKGFQYLKMLTFAKPKWQEESKPVFYGNGAEEFNRRHFENGKWKYAGGGIIDEGRASYSVPAQRALEVHRMELSEYDEDETVEESEIYLNCKGWIINGCDWSYERQDDPEFNGRICHVRSFSFAAIKRYNKKLGKLLEV